VGYSIAMCTNANTRNLHLVYMSAGSPQSVLDYKQTADGVWHPAVPALDIPGDWHLSTITGVSGNEGLPAGLLAAALNGSLYFATQGVNDNWNPIGVVPLPSGIIPLPIQSPPNTITTWFYEDVNVAWVKGLGLVVMSLATGGSLYAQYGDLTALSQPVLINNNVGPMDVAGIDPLYSDSSGRESDDPTAVVFANLEPITAFTFDGGPWNTYSQPHLIAGLQQVVIGYGNAGSVLQALALDVVGAPKAYWDTSGNGTRWTAFTLPFKKGMTFSKLAAANGNPNGNLQVVGLSDGLPYLVQQDAAGNWTPYMGSQGQQLPLYPGFAVTFTDLCMGMGPQGSLQVGYLGSDGNIYVSWQDQNNEWGFYGPLP
jgi:hypothetical protein